MLHLYDRATMEGVLTLPLDARLHDLLAARIGALRTPDGDLSDWTEYLVVGRTNDEVDIMRAIGFSPLVEPTNNVRYGHAGFEPHWDWLSRHDGWFEMIATFGSTFAYVLFIEDHPDADADLLALCREHAA